MPVTRSLGRALDSLTEIDARIRGRRLALFLDYDGTLTPIVSHPDDAHLSGSMRHALQRAATRWTVAIVSGRDRADVEQRVAIDSLVYVGSHGFDIRGPGVRIEYPDAVHAVPALRAATRDLEERLEAIPGVYVEPKAFAVAVHYRNVDPTRVPQLLGRFDEVATGHPKLRRTEGKCVVELRPDVDWHKGRAVQWLLDALDLGGADVIPIYFGDDLTDEDALRFVRDNGLGLYVGPADDRLTAAHYRLDGVDEVQTLIDHLASVA